MAAYLQLTNAVTCLLILFLTFTAGTRETQSDSARTIAVGARRRSLATEDRLTMSAAELSHAGGVLSGAPR